MGVSASACFRPLRAALFAGFPLIALVTIAAAEPLSDGVNAYARKEYATAKRILRPLAERGSAIAQFYLGLAYERGKSVSESEAEAVSWFRRQRSKASRPLRQLWARGILSAGACRKATPRR